MSAPRSSVIRWALLAGILALGAVELVRGLGHLLSEDSAAARAGVAAESVANADVVYLFALVGGTQAMIGLLLVVAAVLRPQLRVAALALVAGRCAIALVVGVVKPATADGLVGGAPDTAQLAVALVVLALVVFRREPRESESRRTAVEPGDREAFDPL